MWKNFRPLIQTGPLWPEHYEIFFSQTQVTLAIPWIEWSGPGNGSPCGVLKSFQSSLLSIVVKILPYVSTECCLLLLTYPNWSLMSCKSFFEMDRASCVCLLLPVVSVVLLTWGGWRDGELGFVLIFKIIQRHNFFDSFASIGRVDLVLNLWILSVLDCVRVLEC